MVARNRDRVCDPVSRILAEYYLRVLEHFGKRSLNDGYYQL